jgi:RNA-binding protein
LRGLGHELSPHVQIAQSPLSETVWKELETQLNHHELIKVKATLDDRDERHAVLAEIADKLAAAFVQELGKTGLYYRANPKKKKPIVLP